MAPCNVVIVLGLLVAAPAVGHEEKVTPVQKVIALMEGMIERGTKEMEAEQVQFAAYKTFCDTTSAEKQKAIKDANDKIEVLQADIGKAESDAAQLGAAIASLDGDISTWEADSVAAGKVRTIENNDYNAMHADFSSSIEALHTGVDTLRGQHHDVAQAAASLAQVRKTALITPQAKKAIDDFLAQDSSVADENLAVAAPEAAAFESQLQGIIDMLEGLAVKFEHERTTLEKEEMEAKHGYDMLSADLTQQIGAATEARTEKAEKKADSLQAAADARGDMADTATTRDDDVKFVTDLISTCELKSTAFADRQTLRKEEIEAINQAIDILASGGVAGASEKHLPQLLQSKATALTQLRSVVTAPSQLRVAAFLKDEGKRIQSRVLSMIAMKVMADPFKKVKKMIKDLIVKLMEEANEEAETKGFCDTELSTNEHTRKEKTSQVEMLTADIDELTASVTVLTEEIGELSTQLSELAAAVEKALGVLKAFYDKAGKATALDQQPEIFDDAPYKGMGAESGGVVGMIEVIASDFARLESETSAAEAAAAKEYDTFMKDATMDKAMKTKDVEHKTEKELDAAMKYYDKLKPTCVSGGSESFEDRTAQRKEEIESLQEALRILNGEDIAFLQQS